MKLRFSPLLLVILFLVLLSSSANALTLRQFSEICDTAPGDCSSHPVIQAYVGGALDLLATLDEKTDYLETVYCREPSEIFDVAAIIRFMQTADSRYADENAMLVFIQYFEKFGGCQS